MLHRQCIIPQAVNTDDAASPVHYTTSCKHRQCSIASALYHKLSTESIVLLRMDEIIARNMLKLIEIINKVIIVASSWLFIIIVSMIDLNSSKLVQFGTTLYPMKKSVDFLCFMWKSRFISDVLYHYNSVFKILLWFWYIWENFITHELWHIHEYRYINRLLIYHDIN